MIQLSGGHFDRTRGEHLPAECSPEHRPDAQDLVAVPDGADAGRPARRDGVRARDPQHELLRVSALLLDHSGHRDRHDRLLRHLLRVLSKAAQHQVGSGAPDMTRPDP